jgi:hypothetical protein
LWQAAGKLEEAAKQYQAAGRWLQAAEIWETLDQFHPRAKALEEYARSLTEQTVSDEVRARAWVVAAETWGDLGEAEAAEACQIEVARYRRLPHLEVTVNHDGLKLNHWTTLHFIVKNVGFSRAKFLIIRARGGQFEGQVAETRQIITLNAGAAKSDWLDVRPLALGNVPLRLTIEYQDEQEGQFAWSRTIYLPVSRE